MERLRYDMVVVGAGNAALSAAMAAEGQIRWLRPIGGGKAVGEYTADRFPAGGLGGPEPFRLVQALAWGASRAACDAGWAPPDRQVGRTGAIVAPDQYMAIGMNKDPEAPIFKRNHIGMVADYRTVLPALTTALQGVVRQ
ncbi:MAG TPA: FAD-binding protein [Symbiobacteriaceae bacterium]|nr:FAD-binding protein [Symbiobacteriaceae bacterium]